MSIVDLQTGLRRYNQDISQYTGMLGGLTADVHTLRSLNPETTNRVIVVMLRGPYFLMHYFAQEGGNAYGSTQFATYKKMIEYYNTGVQCQFGDNGLANSNLQGGFAARSISIPTVQNQANSQTIQITVPELVGRPIANFHNMWIDGIADPITGLTHYQGLVAGSIGDDNTPKRIFNTPGNSGNPIALEPSPAWEVAEFLIIALDRSGARVEGAIMALGCVPTGKVGYDIFNSNASGTAALQTLTLSYNCQFVESAYVNDLATRYVQQFAVFGHKLNFNPGAGDAFFSSTNPTTYGDINTDMFNGGKRPDLDAVQSGVGNIPVFRTNNRAVTRDAKPEAALTPADHSKIYNDPNGASTSIADPYATTAAPG